MLALHAQTVSPDRVGRDVPIIYLPSLCYSFQAECRKSRLRFDDNDFASRHCFNKEIEFCFAIVFVGSLLVIIGSFTMLQTCMRELVAGCSESRTPFGCRLRCI